MDPKTEIEGRIAFIRSLLKNAGAKGVVYGNSGGKDSALVGILCKAACENTLGIIMPCGSGRNYKEDRKDALAVASAFHIETMTVDLTDVKALLEKNISASQCINQTASININPRLRMTTLYAVAASRNALVAGTGNASESYVGYFTKWGDGACDFNPVSDLSVGKIYELLEYLKAPRNVIDKAPSAGLFEGQTDEEDMGIAYSEIDKTILGEQVADAQVREKIEARHRASEHKRRLPYTYAEFLIRGKNCKSE